MGMVNRGMRMNVGGGSSAGGGGGEQCDGKHGVNDAGHVRQWRGDGRTWRPRRTRHINEARDAVGSDLRRYRTQRR